MDLDWHRRKDNHKNLKISIYFKTVKGAGKTFMKKRPHNFVVGLADLIVFYFEDVSIFYDIL